jgi:hypothetical protein
MTPDEAWEETMKLDAKWEAVPEGSRTTQMWLDQSYDRMVIEAQVIRDMNDDDPVHKAAHIRAMMRGVVSTLAAYMSELDNPEMQAEIMRQIVEESTGNPTDAVILHDDEGCTVFGFGPTIIPDNVDELTHE